MQGIKYKLRGENHTQRNCKPVHHSHRTSKMDVAVFINFEDLVRQNHHPLGEDFCQLASSLRMVVPLLITTSRRRALSTWRCVSGKACRSSSRLSLARQPVLGRTTTSPTSLRLARQVSASHDKSPPPTSAWAQTHGSGEATSACGEANLHVIRGRQLVAMQTTCPGRSLKYESDQPRSHHIAINLRSATRKAQPEALEHPLRRTRAKT
jgi:hypothetical protein